MALAAVLVCSAVASASASAFEWVQGETSMKWTASSITLKKNGASPVSCEFGSITSTIQGFMPGYVYGAKAEGWGGVNNEAGELGYVSELSCAGGTSLEIEFHIYAEEETSPNIFRVGFNPFFAFTQLESPYGRYAPEWSTGTFINGDAKNTSRVSFKEALIGVEHNAPWNKITMNGSFQVTQANGSLLTLES